MKKISIEDFNKILADAKKMGLDLRMSDIFYTFELQRFDNKEVVYTVLFGKGNTQKVIDDYDKSRKIRFLKKYINTNYPIDSMSSHENTIIANSNKKKHGHDDITFEENKAYMLKLKKETEDAIENGEIEKKDGLKILADLSVKLNDKFAVSEKQDEQRIIVYPKFNTICERTNSECWLQTKEFAMQHWGLIEDPNKKNNNDNGDE